jgi:hypothetical protein
MRFAHSSISVRNGPTKPLFIRRTRLVLRPVDSENFRPTLCNVIDAQVFERLAVHPIRYDERCLWDDQFPCANHAGRAAYFWVVGRKTIKLSTLIKKGGSFSTPIGRAIDMKNIIFPTAFAIIIAAMALGFATVSPRPPSQEAAPPVLRLADLTGTGIAHRSYCFSGARSEQGHLDRGWVCLTRNVPQAYVRY